MPAEWNESGRIHLLRDPLTGREFTAVEWCGLEGSALCFKWLTESKGEEICADDVELMTIRVVEHTG